MRQAHKGDQKDMSRKLVASGIPRKAETKNVKCEGSTTALGRPSLGYSG
jgi:hypothetical protein